MSDDIQQRITVGQAFNIEAQQVLNNARVEGAVLSSKIMNAEISTGMAHTVANIQGYQDSYVNAIKVANEAFNKSKTEPAQEQAFEV